MPVSRKIYETPIEFTHLVNLDSEAFGDLFEVKELAIHACRSSGISMDVEDLDQQEDDSSSLVKDPFSCLCYCMGSLF